MCFVRHSEAYCAATGSPQPLVISGLSHVLQCKFAGMTLISASKVLNLLVALDLSSLLTVDVPRPILHQRTPFYE